MCTFHSACVRILRRDGDRLGYPRRSRIYDQADAVRLTGYVIRDLSLDAKRFPPRAAARPDQRCGRTSSSARSRRRARRQHLRAQARRHLRRVPGPPAEGRRHGLRRPADEDRRAVPRPPRRARALPAAVPAHARRRVPGHQPGAERDRAAARRRAPQRHASSATRDQSIYRFRGADIRNILEFEEAFPDVTTIVLDQNYRCTQTILDAANAVIANNLGRKPKKLWTELGPRRPHRALPRRRRGRRGPWVARTIARLHDASATAVERDGGLLPHQRPEPRASKRS